MSLDKIFIKHNTDKSSLSHNYAPVYEKHLPKKINKFLEIGAWKGAGIRSFKEWYNHEGMFYAMDRFLEGHGLVTIAELQAEGINAFQGDHDEMWFLEGVKDKFTVLVEDGSHHFISQLNIFRRMFVHNIEQGGWYVIEDAFDDPYWGQGIVETGENIRNVFKRYKEKGKFDSKIITPKEADVILPLIDDIHIYEEIIFVKRK